MSQDGHVCDFGNNEQYYPTEGVPPNAANSRLIAAAPDLLKQLQMCVTALEMAGLGDSLICKDAVATITIATGGAA
jgi:hypothetical protein